MKFYGNGSIWSPEKNKIVVRFINGEFDTDDKELIDFLIKNNVVRENCEIKIEKDVEIIEKAKKINYEEMTNSELREILKKKGILDFNRKSKTELIKMIVGD